MVAPTGFSWSVRSRGEIAISRDGRAVTLIRGRQAERLVERLTAADEQAQQHLMARATGNYRRGNERP